jgi:hypothetical protein
LDVASNLVCKSVTLGFRTARSGESTGASAIAMSNAKAPLSLDRCLEVWGEWERGYRFGPQNVRGPAWAPNSDGSNTKAIVMMGRSNEWVAQHVSKSIDALPKREWKLVLEIEYVWNGRGARVFRNNRLPSDSAILAELLEQAKQAVTPILRGRGVPV